MADIQQGRMEKLSITLKQFYASEVKMGLKGTFACKFRLVCNSFTPLNAKTTAESVATELAGIFITISYPIPECPLPEHDQTFRQWRAWWQRYQEHQHQRSDGRRPSWIHQGCKLRKYIFRVVVVEYGLPDKGVDLDGVNIVELLQSLLDLTLVGTDIDDEDESVVLLNLLHGALSVERVDDDLVLIEAWLMGNRLAWVFGSPRELEGLRLVEGGRETDLADLVGVDLNRISALI